MKTANFRLLVICLTCFAALVLAWTQAPAAELLDKPPSMYEDIEVMRRLLARSLQDPGASTTVWVDIQNSKTYTTGTLHYKPLYASLVNSGDQSSALEGSYLPGTGVVYTATVPDSLWKSDEAAKPAAKALSSWDLARKQLRGEKVETAPARAPDLAERILKVLFDNGHHLKLAEAEGISVAITFRRQEKPKVIRAYPVAKLTIPNATDSHLLDALEIKKSAMKKLAPDKWEPDQPSGLELLGDLHMKQARTAEAITAYEKAVKEAKAKALPALYRKLAQAYLKVAETKPDSKENYAKALEYLSRITGEEAKAAPKAAKEAKPEPLPGMLVVSAPHKLLVLAGAGKVDFVEFKKAATVQWKIAAAGDPKADPMVEDMEVMRRLMDKALTASSVDVDPELLLSYYLSQQINDISGNSEPYSAMRGKSLTRSTNPRSQNVVNYWVERVSLQGTKNAQPDKPAVEGTYVSGHGAVFTATVPASLWNAKPAPAKPVAALSDWERTRMHLRGEKIETVAVQRQAPDLANVVLRTLFENGRHFKSLPGEESLTVAITFRKVATGADQAVNANLIINETYVQVANETITVPGLKSPATDYELLGDLHLKQGKTANAIESYEKAVKEKPESKKLAVLYRKLAQAYLQDADGKADAQKYAAWDKAMESMKRAKGQAEARAKPKDPEPEPLPRKLIITVPKKLLDLTGTGKLKYEDFKKAASVQYLEFLST